MSVTLPTLYQDLPADTCSSTFQGSLSPPVSWLEVGTLGWYGKDGKIYPPVLSEAPMTIHTLPRELFHMFSPLAETDPSHHFLFAQQVLCVNTAMSPE